MKRATAASSVVGCLAICSAWAQAATLSWPNRDPAPASGRSDFYPAGRDASGTSWQPDSTLITGTMRHFDNGGYPVPGRYAPTQAPDVSATYRFALSGQSSVFGYLGQPGEPALGPPVSYMRRLSGFDATDLSSASHWQDSGASHARVVTLGYVWHQLKLEGSAFSARQDEERGYAGNDLLRFNSTSGRLSFNPLPNWSFQLSRGRLGGLDLLEPDEDVRRTTISTTYNRAFRAGNWQTTLAWGRNARKSQEPVMGYLLESTLRFSGTHAIFGRLEQVGSDELSRDDASAQQSVFKMKRFTVGYFHHMQTAVGPGFDIGGFASRHMLPSAMAATVGNQPTSYMMFIRLRFE